MLQDEDLPHDHHLTSQLLPDEADTAPTNDITEIIVKQEPEDDGRS